MTGRWFAPVFDVVRTMVESLPASHPLPIVYLGIGRWYTSAPRPEQEMRPFPSQNAKVTAHLQEMMQAFRTAGSGLADVPIYVEDDPTTRNVIDAFFAQEPPDTKAIYLYSKDIQGNIKNYGPSVIFSGHFNNKSVAFVCLCAFPRAAWFVCC